MLRQQNIVRKQKVCCNGTKYDFKGKDKTNHPRHLHRFVVTKGNQCGIISVS